MLAVAARVGAPLGHDFCALSLSDNLKPWELIERRLDAAAGAAFVIALYNPVSRARPWQLPSAFEPLRPQPPALHPRGVPATPPTSSPPSSHPPRATRRPPSFPTGRRLPPSPRRSRPSPPPPPPRRWSIRRARRAWRLHDHDRAANRARPPPRPRSRPPPCR